MKKYLAFGVNIGNLGRTKKRMAMKMWTQQINAGLARRGIPLKITDWYGHTGNFVLEAAGLKKAEVKETICPSLGTTAAVMTISEVIKARDWIKSLSLPVGSSEIRSTRGLVFLGDSVCRGQH